MNRLERQLEAAFLQIDALTKKVGELQDENERLKRKLDENSTNSHLPPSSDSPQDRASRSRRSPSTSSRGGQPGRKGSKRTLLPANKVNSITNCHPLHCRRCARGLPKRRDPNPRRHQVWDLPKVEPIVDEYRLHHTKCEVCGETTCATLPDGVPLGSFGPGVLSLATMLVADGHMSRRKVVGVLRDAFGLDISLGALSESEELVSKAVAPAVSDAYGRALRSNVKHVDATSWFEAGVLKTLWVMATPLLTVFTIVDDGSRATLREWIGSGRGVMVSDRGRQMDFWAMHRRQICWAHLIRKFAAFAERKGRAGEIGRELLYWSRMVILTHHRVRDGTCPRSELQRASTLIRAVMYELLEEGQRLHVHGVSGSCYDMLKHREAMWTFVNDPDVEPTNNHAERELRGLVTWRKSSFGSQSDRGNAFAANLKSVIQTCRKQGANVLAYLRSAVEAMLFRRQTPSLLHPAR